MGLIEVFQNSQIFHKLILDTTILSMSQKKNILKSIMEKYPQEFDEFSDIDKRKKLFQDLDQIIKLRNALAHGRIVIDCRTDIVSLNYYDSNQNKQREIELSATYCDAMNKKISSLLSDLSQEDSRVPEINAILRNIS